MNLYFTHMHNLRQAVLYIQYDRVLLREARPLMPAHHARHLK